MCNSQAIVDTFSSEMKGLGDTQYFNLTLKCIYMLIVSGNFWKPDPTAGISEDRTRKGMYPDARLVIRNNTLTVTGVDGALSARIITLSGRVVASGDKVQYGNVQCDVSGLRSGIYYVNLSLKGGTLKIFKLLI
jgi:hypothetical protein